MRGRVYRGFGSEEDYGHGRRFREHAHFPLMRRGFVGLRYWILNLTSRHEMTGAQIIESIGEMSLGGYSPSPGTIYPALKSMTEQGYLKFKEVGLQKFYKATEKGKRLLETFSWPMEFSRRRRRLFSSFEGINNDSDIMERLSGYIEYLKDHAVEIKGDKNLRNKFEKLKKDFDDVLQ